MATSLSMVRGDSRLLPLTFTGLGPAGLGGCTIRFTAKALYSDADNVAKIRKSTSDGTITITQAGDTTTPGLASVTLLPADTAALPAQPTTLFWDVQLTDATAITTTVAMGVLSITPDVTQTVP